MPPTYTRRNVYSLGATWAAPVLWYARAVKAMSARALDDPLSWRFFGAIHGFDSTVWEDLGHLSPSDPLPSSADRARFWEQCQHQTWYFLPWHRGYLLAFEAVVRAAIVSLGGPPDWALPYWNYFGPNDEYKLPPEFASPDWPDGTGDNPLFMPQRYGPKNDGDVYVALNKVNLNALTVPDFTGVPRGDAGFGGLDTGFTHYGNQSGDLESQPHNKVHTLLGGSDPSSGLPGLMSDPDTAGLDPIFYLHHANIDRLWEVWQQGGVALGNPTDVNWLGGPAATGERGFSMPTPPSGAPWDYTPADMGDLAVLDYAYDDVSAVVPVAPATVRLQRLGLTPAAVAIDEGAPAMTTSKRAEMVGTNQQSLRISGAGDVRAAVRLDARAQGKVLESFAAATEAQAPDRLFLNLENVRGANDATMLNVYVNERPAGTVSLFGVRRASNADGEHGGQGRTLVLEITNIVDELHLQSGFDVNHLEVRIEPVNPVPEAANVSIERVSIFRQGS
jgi:tyrosinase